MITCFSCRKIFDKKYIGSRSRSWSRILKFSVSEGVVSVLNGQVSVSDDEVSVLVSVSDETHLAESTQIDNIRKLYICNDMTL